MRKSAFFMVAGIVIFVIYLYFFVGINEIIEVFSGINTTQYAIFYSLALVSVLASVFFWSAAWKNILKTSKVNVTYSRAYLYYWVGYFTDLVIPCATVCGEVTRLYLVQKETRGNSGALAAAAVTNRLVAYTIVTVGLYSGAVLIFLNPSIPTLLTNIFVVFLIGVTAYYVVLLYLSVDKRSSVTLTAIYLRLLKRFKPRSYSKENIDRTQKSLEGFYSGFQSFREHPRLLLRPLTFHLLSYLLGLAVYVFIFLALGIYSVPVQFYIVVFFIATAVQDAAASFSVGSLDILLVSIFTLYGITTGLSAVTASLLRSASFWFPLIVGFVSVQLIGARNILVTKKTNPEV